MSERVTVDERFVPCLDLSAFMSLEKHDLDPLGDPNKAWKNKKS